MCKGMGVWVIFKGQDLASAGLSDWNGTLCHSYTGTDEHFVIKSFHISGSPQAQVNRTLVGKQEEHKTKRC